MNQLRLVRVLVLALALPFLTASLASAQDATGTVEGTVIDGAGRPASGVRIQVEGTSIATESAPDGFYRLTFVPPGANTLRFEFPDRGAAERRHAWVSAGQARRLDLDLARAGTLSAPELPFAGYPPGAAPRPGWGPAPAPGARRT